jgi:hypothetical protein
MLCLCKREAQVNQLKAVEKRGGRKGDGKKRAMVGINLIDV